MVSDLQVRKLMKLLLSGLPLSRAALSVGMDPKTARKYRDAGQPCRADRALHTWRTRPDPLAAVWPRLEELLQGEPALQAKTLLEWLQREQPVGNWQRCRRTLERRVRQWKAQHGPAKAVFFARWIALVRFAAAWLAGINRMPIKLFFFWNALGGLTWGITYGLVGYYGGMAAADVLAKVGIVGAIILGVLFLGGLVYFGVRDRRAEE